MTSNSSVSQPGGSDRAAVEKWIKTFLHCAPFGILAAVDDGQPTVDVSLFIYDEAANVIYFHTAIKGGARTSISAGQQVCFTVGEMGRILPADTAAAFNIEYAGVTVFGRAGIVEEAHQAHQAVQRLLDKYAPHMCPGQDYEPITLEEVRQTRIFCIHIDSWCGRKNEALADFPRAYHYTNQPMLPSNYWRGNNDEV